MRGVPEAQGAVRERLGRVVGVPLLTVSFHNNNNHNNINNNTTTNNNNNNTNNSKTTTTNTYYYYHDYDFYIMLVLRSVFIISNRKISN